ncbi:hypothetical protein E2542_SST21064 [Spatholobus suberectus]|nr:hypothetical protein E2542_SST21064 [Spatholobus suberectus]
MNSQHSSFRRRPSSTGRVENPGSKGEEDAWVTRFLCLVDVEALEVRHRRSFVHGAFRIPDSTTLRPPNSFSSSAALPPWLFPPSSREFERGAWRLVFEGRGSFVLEFWSFVMEFCHGSEFSEREKLQGVRSLGRESTVSGAHFPVLSLTAALY